MQQGFHSVQGLGLCPFSTQGQVHFLAKNVLIETTLSKMLLLIPPFYYFPDTVQNVLSYFLL